MSSNSYVRVLFTNCNPTSLNVHNLKYKSEAFLPRTAFHTNALKFYNMFVGRLPILRQPVLRNNCVSEVKNTKLVHTRSALLYVKRELQKIPNSLKQHSVHIVKVCTQQCECVLAHRIRRGQQIFSLYSKLWDEVALKDLIRKMRLQVSRKWKELILGSVGVSAYNWEKERITDTEMLRYPQSNADWLELCCFHGCCFPGVKASVGGFTRLNNECSDGISKFIRHINELEFVQKLRKSGAGNKKIPELSEWEPFIDKGELVVWRKEEQKDKGLYAYKVYGCYPDVTAEDFMHVQIDTEFRREWDNTVVNLQVVEEEGTSNSDIVYWEMEWPRMFSNRDYVFNRRFIVLEDKNLILVMNKATQHPKIPKKAHNVRVTEYWSIMVIKALKNIHEPGMEFSLTYFDNPGVNVPSSITSWVAVTGLPDFQMRLRQAAKDYKNYLARKKSKLPDDVSHLPEQGSSPGSTKCSEPSPEERYDQSTSETPVDVAGGSNEDPSRKPPTDFLRRERFGSWTNLHHLHTLFV